MGNAKLLKPRANTGSVPVYYVSGLGHIELMTGNNARHILVSEHMVGGKMLLLPEVEIIMPNSAVPDCVMKATRTFALSLFGVQDPFYH